MNIKLMKRWHGLHAVLLIFAFANASPVWAQTCTDLCNWYNIMEVPLCQNQDAGFGFEDGQTCVARSTCETQYGGSGVFSQCDDSADELLCNSVNGRRYFSNQLFEMGLTPEGVVLGHRSVEFQNGTLLALQSDYGINGSYRCEAGEIIATLPDNDHYAVEFADDLTSLNFDPFGGANGTPYTLSSDTNADCSLVSEGNYELAPEHLAEVDLPEGITYTARFDNARLAKLYLPAGRFDNALYDCVTGDLHIHTSQFDTTPMDVTIENQGDAILVQVNSVTLWRFLRQEPVMCPNSYDPVCSAVLDNYVCLEGPCPDGKYQTFANRCVSDSENALFIANGECGDREGEYYYEGSDVCTTEYDPVCSVKPQDIACVTEPCPVGVYQTYSNLCHSDADGAQFKTQGDCGDLEGQPFYDEPCGGDSSPVCGIEHLGIVCITGPCPNDFYKTYSNACDAEAAGSPVLFREACGEEREGAPYWGHTPECGADAPYEPRCALKTETHACRTSPCPKQTYRIYSNTCEMNLQGATFLHEEHCGAKTDSFAFDLSDYFNVCPNLYEPVCGKDETAPGSGQTRYTYKTFGNTCLAESAVADLTWNHQGCGALEGADTGNEPTVRMVDSLSAPLKPITVTSASIVFDTIKINFSYSGCSTQHFDLEITRHFSESLPVQAQWAMVAAVADDCDAVVSDSLSYDLLPLKSLYEEAYGSGTATIVLPGLGEYEINAAAPQPTLSVQHPETGVVGEDFSVVIESTHPGNARPGSPTARITDPNGEYAVRNSLSQHSPDGPPWTYWARFDITPAIAGDHSVEIIWDEAPELQQTTTITVSDEPTISECEAAGVAINSVPEYPDWPARDWPGGPYNHANSGDLMSYEDKIFRAQWYTSSLPGSDNSWQFVCNL